MKVWITKYALSQGIEELDVDESNARDGLLVDRTSSGYARYFHGEGREWHRTEEAAKIRADNMRSNRIASLKKQIAKLEKLGFQ